jgi:hypothetical protein
VESKPLSVSAKDWKTNLQLTLALASEELHHSPRFILIKGIVSVELPDLSILPLTGWDIIADG